jgi:tripartite-type tricarboxylate transporter receptor subunit TctC
MKRRTLIQNVTLLAPLAGASTAGAQTAFPDKPVKVVVPFAAGNTLDTALRQVAEVFKQNTGQPLIV